MGVSGPGVKTAEGTHVDDAAVRGAEMRQGFSRDEEWAAGIGFKDCIPLIESQAFKGRGSEDGGVIDEDVETAKGGMTCATAARTEGSERTSQGTARELRPSAAMAAAVAAASDSEERYEMATSAPAWARVSAMARPRRRAPPVTNTDLPARGAVGFTELV